MSQKVLVLYTGGTIGMQASVSGFVPMPDFEAYCLRVLMNKASELVVDIDFVSLDNLIDSADLVPQNWTTIGRELQQHWQRYRGFCCFTWYRYHGIYCFCFVIYASRLR